MMCHDKAVAEARLISQLIDYHAALVVGETENAERGNTAKGDDDLDGRPAAACLRLLEDFRRQHSGWKEEAHPPDAGITDSQGRFGRFQVIRELGRGGQAIVYLAIDPLLERQIALRVPRPDVLGSREMQSRFLKGARAAARLSHPNLVPVFEVGQVGPACYIASQYCEGPTLGQWRKQQSDGLDPRLAVQIVVVLAETVECIHQHGILHRDIKPANVLLEPLLDGQDKRVGQDGLEFHPRLTDFGLVKTLGADGSTTKTGDLIGTPSYMAPEQAEGRNRDVTAATDVYALGVLLFELLTGRPPHCGETPLETIRLISESDPVPPSRFRDDLPRELDTICLRCLARLPAQRYESAAELADEMNRWLRGEAIAAKPPQTASGLSRRRRKFGNQSFITMIAIVACALFVGYGLDSVLSRGSSEPSTTLSHVGGSLRDLKSLARTAGPDRAGLGDVRAQSADRPTTQNILSGLIPQPAKLPGVRRWQIDTVSPRRTVRSVCWSPDDRYLAAGSYDRQLRVFDTTSGRLVAMFSHPTSVGTVAWSPDGRWIATGSVDGNIRLWSFAERKPGPLLCNGQEDVGSPHDRLLSTHLSWSPGSDRLVCSIGRMIRIWDVASASIVKDWRPKPPNTAADAQLLTTALHWSPDGNRIAATCRARDKASGKDSFCLHVWEVDAASSARVFEGYGGPPYVGSLLSWGPDSRRLAVGQFENRALAVLDLRTGETVTIDRVGDLRAVSWSPDGRHIAIGCAPHYAHVFGAATGSLLRTFATGNWRCLAVAWSHSSGRLALSGREAGNIQIWDIQTQQFGPSLGKPTPTTPVPKAWWVGFRNVAWNSDGSQLVTASVDGTARVWNAETGQPTAPLRHDEPVMRADFGAEDDRIETSSFNGKVVAWDLTSNEEALLAQFEPHTKVIWSHDRRRFAVNGEGAINVYESATGTLIKSHVTNKSANHRVLKWKPGTHHLSWFDDDGVYLWTVADEQPRRLVALENRRAKFFWGPRGKRVVTATSQASRGSLSVWNAENGRKVWTKESATPAEYAEAVWSPLGDSIVAISSSQTNGYVAIHSADDENSRIAIPDNRVIQTAWSPDGNYLATRTSVEYHLGQVAIHKVLGGLSRIALPVHNVDQIAWSPDNRHLATVSGNRTLQIWDIENGGVQIWNALAAPDGEVVVFSPTGRVLHESGDTAAELVYIAEMNDGSIETLPREQFERRFGVRSN